MKILDISEHNGLIDLQRFKGKDEVEGVIIRTGWGATGRYGLDGKEDKHFRRHFEHAKSLGYQIGLYHYSYAQTVEQAADEYRFFKSIVGDRTFDLPLFYDVEDEKYQSHLSAKLKTDMMDTFCQMAEKDGYFVGVYSSEYWFKVHFDRSRLRRYVWWVANISNTPSIPYHIHQFTFSYGGEHLDCSRTEHDFSSRIKSGGFNGFSQAKPQRKKRLYVYHKNHWASEGYALVLSKREHAPMISSPGPDFSRYKAEGYEIVALGAGVKEHTAYADYHCKNWVEADDFTSNPERYRCQKQG